MRYFHWVGCPLKSLSSNLSPENLVRLDMPWSTLKELWPCVQRLVKLKHIDLSWSKQLIRCPDLSLTTSLENLILQGCRNLLEIPTTTHLQSLRKVDLLWCSNLKTFPAISVIIEELDLCGTAIEVVPSSIECLSRLDTLSLRFCKRVKNLPSNTFRMKSLEKLNLEGCSAFHTLPGAFGKREMFLSIGNMNNLDRLSFQRCKKQESMGFVLPPNLANTCSLTILDLSDTSMVMLPDGLGQLSSLRELDMSRNHFESIPASIKNLSRLFVLKIMYCKRLQSLPDLPRNLRRIEAKWCPSLETLSDLTSLFTDDDFDAWYR